MAFIDEVQIQCFSGRGGDGHASFRREKFVPRGGPDGGDGGRGGDVILVGSSSRNTLSHIRGRKVYAAKAGTNGGRKGCTGARGQSVRLEVPVGTMVFCQETQELLGDLCAHQQELVLCRGGRGGRGNIHFKSSTNRAPDRAEEGRPGEERAVRLELKLLADVGLLGFPNAGKSTLISVISSAKPAIAPYPFTTLTPKLGVVKMGWEGQLVIADIPGLVEGASEGVGLGHRFLRHVERCPMLLHMISLSPHDEMVSDPVERYQILRGELTRHSGELSQRRERVVLTKADLVSPEDASLAQDRFEELLGYRPMLISAPQRLGLDELTQACWAEVQEQRQQELEEEEDAD